MLRFSTCGNCALVPALCRLRFGRAFVTLPSGQSKLRASLLVECVMKISIDLDIEASEIPLATELLNTLR